MTVGLKLLNRKTTVRLKLLIRKTTVRLRLLNRKMTVRLKLLNIPINIKHSNCAVGRNPFHNYKLIVKLLIKLFYKKKH